MQHNVHGIDHIGLTVPNIEEATQFFVEAFAAEVLYDTYTKNEPLRTSHATTKRLGISENMAERAIRMIGLPNGPQIELFEFTGAEQKEAATPADFGWQHVAFYVDDIEQAVADLERAGGTRNADPIALSGIEKGDGNVFCYCKAPWGSTIELISYPTPQPYLDKAPRRKWPV